jgi:transcriptional regulator with XRE-family HTH domain
LLIVYQILHNSLGFRENLKSELAYRDILVKELSALSGLSRHTIDNYLNVRRNVPTAENAVKIAQVLDVSVEYLVTGQEKPLGKSPLSPEIVDLIQTVKQLNENDRKILWNSPFLQKQPEKQGVNRRRKTGKQGIFWPEQTGP